MSLALETVNNPAIDNLVQSSLESEYESLRLQWIPCSDIVHYAIYKRTDDDDDDDDDDGDDDDDDDDDETTIMLSLLGNDEICTPTLVSEFARIYSLPTHKYNNDVCQFRRYKKWLTERNKLIKGFAEYDDKYYMVADRKFYDYYSLYGFCSTCGILRCSPVWCICGHKQLSDGWTSNNKQLDEFIKKSQLQTNSANDAYLEWIPWDYIDSDIWIHGYKYLYGLPTSYDIQVKLIPLEITDETHDSYYAELCDKHPDILTKDVWVTIGFTYDASEQKYYLIKEKDDEELCLACTAWIRPSINSFCYECKIPRPADWTTGNKSLDSFIIESWKNTKNEYDAYIQWIEYSLLINIQEMTSLHHGCTHIAEWTTTRVTLKKIVDGQSFDFHQLTKEYPEILTPDNIWIIGITQEPTAKEYYLVFYYDVHALLDRFIQLDDDVKYMQYGDFYELNEIGSGGYRTVYTAKYRKYSEVYYMRETVVLKRFKSFDETPELFISEFRNHAKCSRVSFLRIYGVTQDPETKEYMIVMQYANNGSLLSYLDKNINKLTWKEKLRYLKDIARYLRNIHYAGLVHCDLHGGNIVMHDYDDDDKTESLICDLGLSRSVNSRESNPTIRGGLPFIAPEVFHTCKFTQKSDVYSFGIIMYLIATGKSPFRDRQFDRDLVCKIMDGLRPSMPDSAPEEYKNLAERCCDADPDKRPDAERLWDDINNLIIKVGDSDIWNDVYYNDVKPLSRLEKESKYSSTLLPTGETKK